VVRQRNVMADDEPWRFKRLNLFHWMTKVVDRWVHLLILPEQQGQTVIFFRMEEQVPFIKPVSHQMCRK